MAQYFRIHGTRFSRVFSSDLQRARLTAEALVTGSHRGQIPINNEPASTLVLLEALRERDFGSHEGQKWPVLGDARDKESRSSLETRAKVFLDENILPLLAGDNTKEEIVAVVSHGQILSIIWRCLIYFFGEKAISTVPGSDRINMLPWSNTGYLELEIKQLIPHPTCTTGTAQTINPATSTQQASDWRLNVLTVNGQLHLSTLRRTRGGIGSSRHDKGQKQIDGFFAKPKAGG